MLSVNIPSVSSYLSATNWSVRLCQTICDMTRAVSRLRCGAPLNGKTSKVIVANKDMNMAINSVVVDMTNTDLPDLPDLTDLPDLPDLPDRMNNDFRRDVESDFDEMSLHSAMLGEYLYNGDLASAMDTLHCLSRDMMGLAAKLVHSDVAERASVKTLLLDHLFTILTGPSAAFTSELREMVLLDEASADERRLDDDLRRVGMFRGLAMSTKTSKYAHMLAEATDERLQLVQLALQMIVGYFNDLAGSWDDETAGFAMKMGGLANDLLSSDLPVGTSEHLEPALTLFTRLCKSLQSPQDTCSATDGPTIAFDPWMDDSHLTVGYEMSDDLTMGSVCDSRSSFYEDSGATSSTAMPCLADYTGYDEDEVTSAAVDGRDIKSSGSVTDVDAEQDALVDELMKLLVPAF